MVSCNLDATQGIDFLMQYDYVVIGGGFFGARVAIELAMARKKVLLLERESALMQRASYSNQARVHGGYHYPRNLLTALRSRVNLPVFSEEYRDCIDDSFENYYAIASNFSKVSADQFRLFCERIKAPVRPAASSIKQLFNSDLIDDVVCVEEYAFDADKIRAQLVNQLGTADVQVQTKAKALSVSEGNHGLKVLYRSAGNEHQAEATQVLNCSYSSINDFNRTSGLPEVPLKHEVAEVALIEPPDELARKGVTVMDGPFFSTMPFPARRRHSLTHVRYTPHTEWQDGVADATVTDPHAYLKNLKLESAVRKMLADAKRYLPCMANARYIESLYEIKTVLPKSEGDDSRPILFKKDHGLPGFTCIMGAKLDNIYDVFKELSRA